MDIRDVLAVLHSTRRLTVLVVVLLAVQLSDSLYEQVVTDVEAIAAPRAQDLVGELAPGSPLYSYLPWVPLGLVMSVIPAVRLHRWAPASVARRSRIALAVLALALIAKVLLITQVNPRFRVPEGAPGELRLLAVFWAVGNGVAIMCVTIAVVLLIWWRTGLFDAAAGGDLP